MGPEGAFMLRQQQSQLSLCCRIHFHKEQRDEHFSTFNTPLRLFNQLNVNTVSLDCPLKVTTSTMECANMFSLTVNNSHSVPKAMEKLTCSKFEHSNNQFVSLSFEVYPFDTSIGIKVTPQARLPPMVVVDEDVSVGFCREQQRKWGALFTLLLFALPKSALVRKPVVIGLNFTSMSSFKPLNWNRNETLVLTKVMKPINRPTLVIPYIPCCVWGYVFLWSCIGWRYTVLSSVYIPPCRGYDWRRQNIGNVFMYNAVKYSPQQNTALHLIKISWRPQLLFKLP